MSNSTTDILQRLAIAADVALYKSRVSALEAKRAAHAHREADRAFLKAQRVASVEEIQRFDAWLDALRAKSATVAQCHLCGETVGVVWDFFLADHNDRRIIDGDDRRDRSCDAGGSRAQTAIIHYAPGGPENIDADGRSTEL